MLHGYKILVFCTSKIYASRFSDFISSLNEALIQHNWRVMVFCTETDLYKHTKNIEGTRKIFDLINYEIADAIMISDDNILDKLVKQKIYYNAANHDIPVILLEGKNPETYNVRFAEFESFKTIVRHLIERHNAKNLHFLAGFEDNDQSNLRLNAFKEVLAEYNISFKKSMVSYGQFWDVPAKAAIQKLIDEKNLPDAIVCANDTMALAAVAALQANKIKVPEDVIVTGYDGISEINYSTPRISTSVCDYSLLGEETAKYIFEIDEKNIPVGIHYVPSRFTPSESCGCGCEAPKDTLEYIANITNSYNRFRNEDMHLNNISVSIHDCSDIEEVSEILKDPLFYNMFILLKAEFFDVNNDPSVSQTPTTYGSSMFVMLDSDKYSEQEDDYIKTEELIPRMKEILDNYKYPLFFTPLHNVQIPLGYLCFCFCSYDRQNYAKVGQISNWLSNAFSGYRNMQYQKHLQKKIEIMYQHDALTGLLNRNGFTRVYNRILMDTAVTEISLVMCDLDNLKHINDTYSHNEGDEAIRVVGRALSQTAPGGYFCRYGGDEIIGLFLQPVDEELIKTRLQQFIDEYNLISDKPYQVSTSVGIYTSQKKTFDEMFGKADKLMYEQKLRKKNRRV